jgi:hypothetical protein
VTKYSRWRPKELLKGEAGTVTLNIKNIISLVLLHAFEIPCLSMKEKTLGDELPRFIFETDILN